ncbi:16S rRNA (guanine(527)-N(7))-methyltransferase RsmG [Chloroflexota bacterium]
MKRLASGAEKLGLELAPEQLEKFQVYYEEMMDWNRRINLTAITDGEEVQVKHFLDSLTVIPVVKQLIGEKDFSLIDVGTGAGIPGIPLKILFPEIKLVLLDATAKKAAFLNYIKDKLGLDGVEIVVGRAEDIARKVQYREKFNLVLSRAVAGLPALVELALPFVAVGGIFIAQKKGDIKREISQSARAINLLGGNLRETRRVDLEELSDKRWLIVIDKLAMTPEQYPRRPGIPVKRPLI